MTTEAETEPRFRLSRERVLRAAVKVADGGGIESLTMRRLAEELGSEAMSLCSATEMSTMRVATVSSVVMVVVDLHVCPQIAFCR